MERLSCGEQCLLQPTSVPVDLLVQLGQQTARKTLRKMFLTCCSKSITGFTHLDLPLVPEVLQVNWFDSPQLSNPPPSLPAMNWCVGHSNLVSSLRLNAAHTY